MLKLEHSDRIIFDKIVEEGTGKSCDEAIELLNDNKVRKIVELIKKRKKKKKQEEMLVKA
jgi:hypothetical protein